MPTIIFDLDDPSGPAEILMHDIDAREYIERDPRRYVRELPKGKTFGPRSGVNGRIVRT
jgi:hypothetical protein